MLVRNVTVLFSLSPTPTRSGVGLGTRNYPGSLHAIDATQNELNYLDTIYLREMSLYFLKLAIDQITSAAPAQKDAGGTVEE